MVYPMDISVLVGYLLEVNCAEGAKEVGNLIASSFANIHHHLDTCVSCYIRLGHAERLQSLFSDIFRAPPFDFEANFSKKNLLEILISSPVIWELATSSELGKSTLSVLAMYQLILLRDEPASTFKVRRQSTTPGETFLPELLSCLKFIGRLERNSYPVDSKYMSTLQPLLDQLEIQQLLDIMVDLLNSNEQPPTIGILRFISKYSIQLPGPGTPPPPVCHRQDWTITCKKLDAATDCCASAWRHLLAGHQRRNGSRLSQCRSAKNHSKKIDVRTTTSARGSPWISASTSCPRPTRPRSGKSALRFQRRTLVDDPIHPRRRLLPKRARIDDHLVPGAARDAERPEDGTTSASSRWTKTPRDRRTTSASADWNYIRIRNGEGRAAQLTTA
ncbi:hypothetical protein DAPPUDRAFT_107356 [Daphnia pulex]|uniref:Uncharacterized protein n=1 Tax=Daphnia pulex TaxID=6669 RepID=E9GWV4_DAPPU|nr:hypothetical protein DAPPUDRAFT_107356 [Daphnia pulex]|eukprot:EFX76053.1 hypothetical protein DAPPUDRAFT_107356 [Daphnia pulex]